MTWSTVDPENAIHGADALPHGAQPEVPRELGVRIEATAIVANIKPEVGAVVREAEIDAACVSVLDRVVHRLLGHAVEHLLHGKRHVRLGRQRRNDIKVVSRASGSRLLLDRGYQSLAGKGLGTQLENECAHLRESGFRE